MNDLHKTAVGYAEDLEEAYNNGELYEDYYNSAR